MKTNNKRTQKAFLIIVWLTVLMSILSSCSLDSTNSNIYPDSGIDNSSRIEQSNRQTQNSSGATTQNQQNDNKLYHNDDTNSSQTSNQTSNDTNFSQQSNEQNSNTSHDTDSTNQNSTMPSAITARVTGISWRGSTSPKIVVGDTQKVHASISYDPNYGMPSTALCKWEIADPAIATVDSTGHVTALAAGKTTLTLTYVPTGIYNTCEIWCYKFNITPNAPFNVTRRTSWQSDILGSYVVCDMRIDDIKITTNDINYLAVTGGGKQLQQADANPTSWSIKYRIMDVNQAVVATGSVFTPKVCQGESFTINDYFSGTRDLAPGEYTIDFS